MLSAVACRLVSPSSATTSFTCRPLMPPASFARLNVVSMPSLIWLPQFLGRAGERPCNTESLISLSVTPWIVGARADGPSAATTRAGNPNNCDGTRFSICVAADAIEILRAGELNCVQPFSGYRASSAEFGRSSVKPKPVAPVGAVGEVHPSCNS